MCHSELDRIPCLFFFVAWDSGCFWACLAFFPKEFGGSPGNETLAQGAPKPPEFAQPRLSRAKNDTDQIPKFVASRLGKTSHIRTGCGVIIWAKFGLLSCYYYLGQVRFLHNTFCQKHYNIGVSAQFFCKKNARANLRCYYLGQVGHF